MCASLCGCLVYHVCQCNRSLAPTKQFQFVQLTRYLLHFLPLFLALIHSFSFGIKIFCCHRNDTVIRTAYIWVARTYIVDISKPNCWGFEWKDGKSSHHENASYKTQAKLSVYLCVEVNRMLHKKEFRVWCNSTLKNVFKMQCISVENVNIYLCSGNLCVSNVGSVEIYHFSADFFFGEGKIRKKKNTLNRCLFEFKNCLTSEWCATGEGERKIWWSSHLISFENLAWLFYVYLHANWFLWRFIASFMCWPQLNEKIFLLKASRNLLLRLHHAPSPFDFMVGGGRIRRRDNRKKQRNCVLVVKRLFYEKLILHARHKNRNLFLLPSKIGFKVIKSTSYKMNLQKQNKMNIISLLRSAFSL